MDSQAERIRDAERRLFASTGLTVEERFVDLKVEDLPLRLRVLETGSGPPVLLLHPGGYFGAQWAPILRHLPGHRLIAVDFAGHGLSDGVDYRKTDVRRHIVAMLRQLMAELGLVSASFVGNSLGGSGSLWLAIDEPGLVEKVVILGVPGPILPGGKPDLALTLLSIPGLNRLILKIPLNPQRSRAMSKAMLMQAAVENSPPEIFEIHALANGRPEAALTLSTFMQSVMRFGAANSKILLTDAELAGIAAPVHFIWGDGDIYGAPEMAERVVPLMQKASLEIHQAGHCPQLSDPALCGKSITGFLSAA